MGGGGEIHLKFKFKSYQRMNKHLSNHINLEQVFHTLIPTTEVFILKREKNNFITKEVISRKCRNLENKKWLEQPS